MNRPVVIALIGVGALVAAGVAWFVIAKKKQGPAPESPEILEQQGMVNASATITGMPPIGEPVDATVPGELAPVQVVLAVYEPAKLRQAITANPWLKDTLEKPLGRGFAGPWAGFLGSRGEDLKATFSATVFKVIADELLDAPFSAVWFSGAEAPGSPALVVPKPSDRARRAFAALDTAARRRDLKVASCPGESAPAEGPKFTLGRWVIADHAVYAAASADRLVVARVPNAAIFGLCVALEKLPSGPASGTAFELAFAGEGLGRDFQLMEHVLGIDPASSPRLAFAIDGDKVRPLGISAPLAADGRLAVASLPEEVLKLVPEDVPVLLSASVKLPAQLDRASLKNWYAAPGGAGEARQATVLWSPRGDPSLPTQVALVWSRPEDEPALGDVFSGLNKMEREVVCGQQVLASTRDYLERIKQACAGGVPSLVHAAPEVTKGLRSNSSVTLGVNLGRLLSQLTLDAWRAEQTAAHAAQAAADAARVRGKPGAAPQAKPLPPVPAEIESARRTLEGLPFLGFTGAAREKSLVPGGFRS